MLLLTRKLDKWIWFESCKQLPFVHQPERVIRKASDLSAPDWWYKKNRNFAHTVVAFLRAGNPCKIPHFRL